MFKQVLHNIDKWFGKLISVSVVISLLFLVVISFVQILLRNVAQTGIPWGDIVLRHVVLTVGMLGAVLAARGGRQIAIDVLSRIATPKIRVGLFWLTGVFTIIVCYAMTKASLVFIASEIEYKSTLMEGLPAWPFQVIIPLGFTLIAFQILLNLLLGRRNDIVEQSAGGDEL